MSKQTRTGSRLLAALLALVMCLGYLPGTAWAATGLSTISVSIANAEGKDINGVVNAAVSGDTVTIPAGTTYLDLYVGVQSGVIFSSHNVSHDGRPNSNTILISGDCGLAAASCSNAWTAFDLQFTGTAVPGRMDITFYGFAPVDDPDGHVSDENGRVLGSNTLHVVVSEPEKPSNPDPKPEEKGVRIDFFPNGGTVTSIKGCSRDKIMSRDPSVPEDILFIDANSGVAGMMTDKDGNLPSPPVVEREGYSFDGWYTIGSSQINDAYAGNLTNFSGSQKHSAPMRFTAEANLAAKWTKAETAAPFRIDFNPEGGRITKLAGKDIGELKVGQPPICIGDKNEHGIDQNSGLAWMTTDKNGKLPSLPAVERAGYRFLGWNGSLLGMSSGNVTASTVYKGATTLHAIWEKGGSEYTVKFDLDGRKGTAPADQKVKPGGTVTLPSLPASGGYRCAGWYVKDGGSRRDWTASDTVSGDMTLYAKWVLDHFSFNNGYDAFGRGTYAVSGQYLTALLSGLSAAQKAEVLKQMNSSWGGSCFGMSAVFTLSTNGRLTMGPIQTGAQALCDLSAPLTSADVFNLINYYHLQQFRPESDGLSEAGTVTRNNAYYYYPEEAMNGTYAKYLVEEIQQTNAPVIVCFLYGQTATLRDLTSNTNAERYGHAVVGLDCESTGSGYEITIWDPNDRYGTDTLSVGKDYSVSFASGDYPNARIKGSLPLAYSAETYDHENIQSRMSSRGGAAGAAAAAAKLSTTLDSFTITAADGTSAVFRDGVFEGDLKAACGMGMAAGTSGGVSYAFPGSASYTVTTASDAAGKVSLLLSGCYVDVDSAGLRELKVTGDGQIAISSEKAARQTISVTSDALGGTWNTVTVSGTDTGFALKVEEETLTLSSDHDVSVTVTGGNVDTGAKSASRTHALTPAGAAISTKDLNAASSQPSAFPFTDVGEGRWYRPYVQAAYEAGLVNGVTPTTYEPDKTLTLAESVTLAARICAEARGETAPSRGSPWYKAAYDYCVEKGVIDGEAFSLAAMTRTATRYEMVSILDGAVPRERMEESVQVDKDGIPDLKEADACGEVVYRWYRAGLIGGDTDGSFNGGREIKRSEMAKILCTINRLA